MSAADMLDKEPNQIRVPAGCTPPPNIEFIRPDWLPSTEPEPVYTYRGVVVSDEYQAGYQVGVSDTEDAHRDADRISDYNTAGLEAAVQAITAVAETRRELLADALDRATAERRRADEYALLVDEVGGRNAELEQQVETLTALVLASGLSPPLLAMILAA